MNRAVKFLTSVKLAIVLIILVILASVVGTLIPQDRGPADYVARYGSLAGVMTRLGLTHLYRSAWYLALLLFLAVNIVVCSVERLGGKWRRATRPEIRFDGASLQAQGDGERVRVAGPAERAAEAARAELRRMGYRVREEAADKAVRLLGRKRTWGLFGSDVVHLGLIVILAGGLLSGLAGRREYLPLFEGRSAEPLHAGFSVRLDRFETEMYPRGGIKAWKSTVTVVDQGRDVLTRTIQVNHPLAYRGVNLYQSSYGWDWTSPSLEVWVRKKSDAAFLARKSLRPGDKDALEPGVEVSLERFVPDFVIGPDREVETRSEQPNNPAALISITRAGEPLFSGWVFANYPDFDGMHSGTDSGFTVELKGARAPEYSVLEAARDPGAGLIWVGCALVMAGLFLAFYWRPREIRVVITPGPQGKTEVLAAGRPAQVREGFGGEVRRFLSSFRSAS